MDTYTYKTTPTHDKDKGERTAIRCSKEEFVENKKRMQKEGYRLVTKEIAPNRWAYWWEK